MDKRKEHWLELQKSFENTEIKFQPFIAGDGSDSELKYDYIDNPNPDVSTWGYGREGFKHHHWNALQCHKRMIQYAKDCNWSSVLLLEDDAYLTSRFFNGLNYLDGFVDYLNLDVLYLGWWVGDENDSYNTAIEERFKDNQDFRLERVGDNLGGLHGALVFSHVYDYILSLPENNPIDSQLNMTRGILRYIVQPKLIHVKSIYSFTEGVVLNRKEL